jgi:hypothetical protein
MSPALSPFGALVRCVQRAAGVDTPSLAAATGIPADLLAQLDSGALRQLPEEHWPALAAALPQLSLAVLASAADADAISALRSAMRRPETMELAAVLIQLVGQLPELDARQAEAYLVAIERARDGADR